jgi:hypothetical protein
MISQDLIDRGGSKLEITRALLEAGYGSPESGIPIPHSVFRYYGQDLNSIRADFERLRKPVIVRGSHRNDYHGFIDVILTHKNISSFSELEDAVTNIEETTDREVVKIHSEDWGQTYTPEVHILIQEQSPSYIAGSMIRHPHDKQQWRIQYRDITDKVNIVSYAQIRRGYDSLRESHKSRLRVTDDEIRDVVDLYEKLETCGVLDTSFSQHMEFGLRPLMFYQARPFKKFQPAQNFEIPWGNTLKHPYMTAREYFGITPEEGVELPFFPVRWKYMTFIKRLPPELEEKAHGLILLNRLLKSPATGKQFGKLVAFCSPCPDFSYLFHRNYRLMKRAEFSFIDFLVFNVEASGSGRSTYSVKDVRDFRESRLFCNGNRGIIIPTKYL